MLFTTKMSLSLITEKIDEAAISKIKEFTDNFNFENLYERECSETVKALCLELGALCLRLLVYDCKDPKINSLLLNDLFTDLWKTLSAVQLNELEGFHDIHQITDEIVCILKAWKRNDIFKERASAAGYTFDNKPSISPEKPPSNFGYSQPPPCTCHKAKPPDPITPSFPARGFGNSPFTQLNSPKFGFGGFGNAPKTGFGNFSGTNSENTTLG